MLRLIHSLGRLSVRGYLILAGLAIVTILATYSNLQNERQLAAERAHQQAIQRQQTLAVNLQGASSASTTPTTSTTPSSTPAQTLSDTAKSTLPAQSSAVAKARTQAGTLVFAPASIALSLSRSLPTVTVAASDGAHITTPEVISTSGSLGLAAQSPSSSPSPSWHMLLSGRPATGTYQLTLHATSVSATGVTTEYTGTLTVVVIL